MPLGKTWIHGARPDRTFFRGTQGDERASEVSASFRSFIFRVLNVTALCAWFVIGWDLQTSRAQQPDFGV
jgi:hypothetical protein